MKLYGTVTSPYVRHCRMVLLATQQDFELVTTDYAGSARLSPTARVPFLEDGALKLFDSSAILCHLRQKAGQAFLSTPAQFDFYCLTNTALDAGITLLLTQKMDGRSSEGSVYLTRQRDRLEASLDELDARLGGTTLGPLLEIHGAEDVGLRLVCLLGWGRFRNMFDTSTRSHLQALMKRAEEVDFVRDTTPFDP